MTTSSSASPDPSAKCSKSAAGLDPVAPVRAVLSQLTQILAQVSDEQFALTGVAGFSGSLGQHVRHCLDHVSALAVGVESGKVDYEARERGTLIESDRITALKALAELDQQLAGLPADAADRKVCVAAKFTPGLDPVWAPSTVCRELAFVLSHTIHHGAIMAAILRDMKIAMPEHFGYAPGTIDHLKRTQCAR